MGKKRKRVDKPHTTVPLKKLKGENITTKGFRVLHSEQKRTWGVKKRSHKGRKINLVTPNNFKKKSNKVQVVASCDSPKKSASSDVTMAIRQGRWMSPKAMPVETQEPTSGEPSSSLVTLTPTRRSSRGLKEKPVVRRLLDAVKCGDFKTASELLQCKEETELTSKNVRGEALLKSAFLGHIGLVQLLVELGTDVNRIDYRYGTPLIAAVENGYFDIAKFLICKGADVRRKLCNGDTALMLAVKKGHNILLVQHILDSGASIDERNRAGQTPTMICIQKCDLNTLMLLLHHGARLDIKDKAGKSALDIATERNINSLVQLMHAYCLHPYWTVRKAIETNSVGMMKALHKCGFVYSGSINSETILKRALGHGFRNGWDTSCKIDKKIFKSIHEKEDENVAEDAEGIQPLLLAAACGCDKIVRFLINAGADVNVKDNDKMNALMHAAKNGHSKVIKILIENGVVAEQVGEFGNTALSYALGEGNIECARQLIAFGVPINPMIDFSVAASRDQCESLKLLLEHEDVSLFDANVLSTAVCALSYKAAPFLIESGMDVNALMFSGETVLMEATTREMVEMLISKGASVNKKGLHGQTALIKFCSGVSCDEDELTQDEIVAVLLKNAADVNDTDAQGFTPLIKAALYNRENVTRLLLGARADVNKANGSGQTALMLAAQRGLTLIMMALLEHRAEVNLQAKDGFTALMYAAMNSYSDSVRLLLDHKADVGLEEKSGNTALLLATDVKVVKMLAESGADVNKQNRDGFSSLMFAARSRIPQLVKTLIELGADVGAFEKGNKETALSLLLKMSNLNEEGYSCIETLVAAGSAKVHSSHCDITLAKMIIHNRRKVVKLCVSQGSAPSLMCARCLQKYHCFSKQFCDSLANLQLSPLDVALICGDKDIANYLVANCFLLKSDLRPRERLRDLLVRDNCTESVAFLDQFLSLPPSLFQLTLVAISSALQPSQVREAKIKETGLPPSLQNELLFKFDRANLEEHAEFVGQRPDLRMGHT
ncbi:unnamed protein product [Lymnaea stagnalis]|uniref:Uncharacterized protein n=1 Tax=Lymnaea stagnalis TaxID=6523 RepID=A0AAV2H8T5_LYMST